MFTTIEESKDECLVNASWGNKPFTQLSMAEDYTDSQQFDDPRDEFFGF